MGRDVDGALPEQDRRRLVAAETLDRAAFGGLIQTLAPFGAGEEAVTEDLAPMMLAFDGVGDQMFISSQIYEEANTPSSSTATGGRWSTRSPTSGASSGLPPPTSGSFRRDTSSCSTGRRRRRDGS